MTDIQTIKDDFAFLDDWEDRYRYVIELGKAMPDLPEADKTDENKVRGCASQVWLVTETSGDRSDPVMTFRGDSDAHIVRGLVAILLAAVAIYLCRRQHRHGTRTPRHASDASFSQPRCPNLY